MLAGREGGSRMRLDTYSGLRKIAISPDLPGKSNLDAIRYGFILNLNI
jgi:hypothetical protein